MMAAGLIQLRAVAARPSRAREVSKVVNAIS